MKIKVLNVTNCASCGELISSKVVNMKYSKIDELKKNGKITLTNNLYENSYEAIVEMDNGLCNLCKTNNLRSVIFL